MNEKTRVLFVCVENSCRSQIAEAFARIHGGEDVEAYSSGSRPSGVVNEKAIEAMRELGYDLSAHTSKSLDDIPQVRYDLVATMGCGDECPLISCIRREDWAIPDPKEMSAEEFRGVRDEIERRVRIMLTSLATDLTVAPAQE
ncbi:MAG: arsenate reductase ArsC [Blastocatellia bacterium]|nr:arsenate reductase ArsC [Blastocatellia bacterium]